MACTVGNIGGGINLLKTLANGVREDNMTDDVLLDWSKQYRYILLEGEDTSSGNAYLESKMFQSTTFYNFLKGSSGYKVVRTYTTNITSLLYKNASYFYTYVTTLNIYGIK